MTDECKALLEAPLSDTVTRDDFGTHIPALAMHWEQRVKEAFEVDVRKASHGALEQTAHPLDLAVTIFVCTHCVPVAVMRFPAVLSHPCRHVEGDSENTAALEESYERPSMNLLTDIARRLCGVLKPTRANLNRQRLPRYVNDVFYSYDTEVLQRMFSIVAGLGLEPTTATREELAACDARLRCAQCAEDDEENETYAWDDAVRTFRDSSLA